jgi:hypothetical protein
VGLLIILFVLAAAGVVVLMYLRPPVKTRFRNPERAEVAGRIERGAHIALGITFVSMILFGIGRSPSAILRFLWLVLIVGGFAAFALAHYIASRVHVSGVSRPGAGPAPAPAPERREPTTRQPSAERRPPASRPRPAAGSNRPDRPAGEGERPPQRPRPAGPPASGDRPPQRTRPKPEGGGSPPQGGPGRRPQRPAGPPRPAGDRPPAGGPSTGRPPAGRPPADPEAAGREAAGRRPNPGRPPGLRRPNPIPPEPESARASTGDKANHEAAPDDPTELGGLP